VPTDELRDALHDYVAQANASARVAKTLRNWSCLVHVETTDTGARFSFDVRDGAIAAVDDGHVGTPDLVVRGHSMDLAEIFWGDADPASNYMQGAVTTRGRADDVMRLDAMAMFVFLGE
jgi:hypothetical protein